MNSETILITGASRGIGAGITQSLAKQYANTNATFVLIAKQNKAQLEALSTRIADQFHITTYTQLGDIGDAAYVTKLSTFLMDKHLEITTLINNAGIAHIGLLQDMTDQQWHRIMTTNLDSVFYLSRMVIPSMVRQKEGRIINISSVWGTIGASCEVAYSASKGAINAYTKALAKELAPSNISVNAVACGVIDTDMNTCFNSEERQDLIDEIPSGRMGLPSDVGDAVRALLETPTYLTGQIITLDGGWQ